MAAPLAADFVFLRADRGVPVRLHEVLAAPGFTTVSLWPFAADSRAEIRAFLNDPPFNLNPKADNIAAEEKIRRRAAAAALMDVWDTVRRRQEERRDVEATRRARGLPHTLPGSPRPKWGRSKWGT